MPRKRSKTLTGAEERVMRVLWSAGEVSVREVTNALAKEAGVAYNTVLTILTILHRKGYVHFRREGRAHIYRPAISQTEARREAFNHFVGRFFGGSKNAFAQYLLEEEDLDPTELAALKRIARDTPKKKGS